MSERRYTIFGAGEAKETEKKKPLPRNILKRPVKLPPMKRIKGD